MSLAICYALAPPGGAWYCSGCLPLAPATGGLLPGLHASRMVPESIKLRFSCFERVMWANRPAANFAAVQQHKPPRSKVPMHLRCQKCSG
jgi:hypothetical protein